MVPFPQLTLQAHKGWALRLVRPFRRILTYENTLIHPKGTL